MTASDRFPVDIEGLPKSEPTPVVDIADGGSFPLRITPMAKQIDGTTVRMLGYNGSVPGPTLRVAQGSEIEVNVVNNGDLDATVHWHGVRVENRYDGTHETQPPIAVGGSFTYRLRFPDAGLYWYHPHIREDYGQEAGLYGNILVVPRDPDYWAPANREVFLTLDDVLLHDGQIAPFSRSTTDYVAMGRFGNVMLTAGDPDARLTAQFGEVVRLYLTNTANTRVFNVGVQGARMKLVGGDSGRYEREEYVERVILAPSERAIVDVLFEKPGLMTLDHVTPDHAYPLAQINVIDEWAVPSFAAQFGVARTNAEMTAERARIQPFLQSAPDKTIAFVAEMNIDSPDGPVTYACPMHPHVTGAQGERCPECGMKLIAVAAPAPAYACPMHPEVVGEAGDHCPQCGMKLIPSQLAQPTAPHDHRHTASDGLEWEDDMVEVNRLTTPANMRWILVDRETGAENQAIRWSFNVGDQVKLRLVNEMDSDHPMHHPFHIHGAGRFLILSRDGEPERNLVWKDTVLVKTGETVDILLDVNNPGRWMAHCHIAEHHESGMMFSFDVADPAGDSN